MGFDPNWTALCSCCTDMNRPQIKSIKPSVDGAVKHRRVITSLIGLIQPTLGGANEFKRFSLSRNREKKNELSQFTSNSIHNDITRRILNKQPCSSNISALLKMTQQQSWQPGQPVTSQTTINKWLNTVTPVQNVKNVQTWPQKETTDWDYTTAGQKDSCCQRPRR